MRQADKKSNKESLRYAVAALLIAHFVAPTDSQAFPYELSYASRITDAQGVPLTGPVDIQVDFFTDPTNSSSRINIPTVAISRVPLADGVFQLSITLTDVEFNTVFANSADTVYIQVTDITHGKTFQRQQFGAAPYALKIPIDNDALRYNNQGQLTVGTNAPAKGQVLMADSAGKLKWTDLSGPSLTTTTPSSGQILGYDGTHWVPQTAPSGGAGGGGSSITGLTGDVAASGVGSVTVTLSPTGVTSGTYTKVTVDAKGRVNAGMNLTAGDIPPLSAGMITSGTLSVANGGTGVNSTATFPISGVVVTRDATETLTNKTLSGSITINTSGSVTSGAHIADGNVTIRGDGTTANKLILNDKGTTNFLALKAPDTLSGSAVWVLPGADGTAGQVLSTNGSGNLTWASGLAPTGAAGGDLTGNFPSPTLAASGISSGTYTKISVDLKGRAVYGTTLTISDIPSLPASVIGSGTLPVSNGGTGTTSFANNGVILGNSGGNLLSTSAGSAYQSLIVPVGGGVPAFSALNLSQSAAVTGILQSILGGTGISSTATFPASGVVVTESATETLTNKTLTAATISGASAISGSTTINTTGTINSGAHTVTGNVTIQGNNTTASKLIFNDKSSANYLAFKAPDTLSASSTWVLPGSDGTSGQVLATNGSGSLSWASGLAPTGAASGDLGGNFPNPNVASVGGVTAANIAAGVNLANAATNANTASTIVKRDVSGNFAASTITGNLTGNVTGNVSGTAGNVTGTVAVANGGTGATTLAANNVLLGNGTSTLQAVAPGGSGNVLMSNGSTWTSAAYAINWGIPGTIGSTAPNSGAFTTLTSSSNVGIGTTAPVAKLDIEGAGGVILNAGNVGIGTTIPSALLEVKGVAYGDPTNANRFQLKLMDTTSFGSGTVGSGISFGGVVDAGGSPAQFAGIKAMKENATSGDLGGNLIFNTRAPGTGTVIEERLRISGSGNVGIGTTNPTAKLQVNGQMVSQQQTILSGATVDFSTGNIQVLKSVGNSSITLNNMQDGAAYTLFITDTNNQTYTFNNCAITHWIQPNAITINNGSTHTMYSIIKLTIDGGVHCYISWITGI